MKNYFDLKGKTAVITGGRRGLGCAMALALVECGTRIAVISQSLEADELKKSIEEINGEFYYIQADLSRREERAGLMAKVKEKFGRLDILINNAGYLHCSLVLEYPMEQWEKDISTLLSAPFELSQQAGKIMREQGGGKIIQIASTAAFKEGAGLIAYATAKSALIKMTRCLAVSLAGFNINVNAIALGRRPGHVEKNIEKSKDKKS